MYLYKKDKANTISIYDFVPNKTKLIELKKKYLEYIKSVIVHTTNKETKEILFTSPTIMFNALDTKEDDEKITYIEETKNDEVISKYVNGEFDSVPPVILIGDKIPHKSYYSSELNNEDSTLLFTSFSYNRTDEGILLTGMLGEFQPLLSTDIMNLEFPEFLTYKDEEVIEFLKIFNCKKKCEISLKNLNFLQENNIISFNDNMEEIFDKSEEVLNNYIRVKKIIKQK